MLALFYFQSFSSTRCPLVVAGTLVEKHCSKAETLFKDFLFGTHSVMFITAVDENSIFSPGGVGFRMSYRRSAVHHSNLTNRHLYVTGVDAELLPESWKSQTWSEKYNSVTVLKYHITWDNYSADLYFFKILVLLVYLYLCVLCQLLSAYIKSQKYNKWFLF